LKDARYEKPEVELYVHSSVLMVCTRTSLPLPFITFSGWLYVFQNMVDVTFVFL